MQEQKYSRPIFTSGRVIKKESFDNLRDFPRDAMDIFYADYSDGIISGFEITYDMEKKDIGISKGILKRDGMIIILQGCSVSFAVFADREICVKLRFGEIDRTDDFESVYVETGISAGFNVGADEIELARFRLEDGAELRKKSEYKGTYDFVTPYNTLNLVNVKYAGLHAPTFSPELLKIFAGEIMSLEKPDVIDISFALTCLNSSIVHKECIIQYLNSRVGMRNNISFDMEFSNEGIHEVLMIIAGRSGSSAKAKSEVGIAF